MSGVRVQDGVFSLLIAVLENYNEIKRVSSSFCKEKKQRLWWNKYQNKVPSQVWSKESIMWTRHAFEIDWRGVWTVWMCSHVHNIRLQQGKNSKAVNGEVWIALREKKEDYACLFSSLSRREQLWENNNW